jgi:hypothetical protein
MVNFSTNVTNKNNEQKRPHGGIVIFLTTQKRGKKRSPKYG